MFTIHRKEMEIKTPSGYLSTHQEIRCLNLPTRREDLHPWDTGIFQVRCKLVLLFRENPETTPPQLMQSHTL